MDTIGINFWHMRDEIERLIQGPRGQKRKILEDKTEAMRRRPQEGSDNQNPPKRRLVQMIMGGSAIGDSNWAWKSNIQALSPSRVEAGRR